MYFVDKTVSSMNYKKYFVGETVSILRYIG